MSHVRGEVESRASAGKPGLLILALTVLALSPAAALAAPVAGARPGVGPDLDYFDAAASAGSGAVAPTAPAAAARTADKSLADKLGPQAVLSTDPTTGRLTTIGRLDGPLSGPAEGDPVSVARGYVMANRGALGLSQADVDALQADPTEISDGLSIVHLRQVVDGIPTWDSGLKIGLDRGNRVLTVTGSPVPGLNLPSTTPTLSAADALSAAVGVKETPTGAPTTARRHTDFPSGAWAELVVFTGAGAPQLAWHVSAPNAAGELADVVVDAGSGALLLRQGLTKFDSGPLYPDYPGAENDPDPAKADENGKFLQSFVSAGWLSASATTLNGPHVHAYSDVNDSNVADPDEEVSTSSGSDFRYALTSFAAPAGSPDACGQSSSLAAPTGVCTWTGGPGGSWRTNRSQTAMQAFYLVNTFADHLAAAPIDFPGFSGQEQLKLETDDGAALGSGDSPDSAHVNNENMTTPPAGQAPRLQTYLYEDKTTSTRQFRNVDGGDVAPLVWHELTHGLSSRLVTYDDGSAALSSAQGGAMGEAWSDWYALDELTRRGLEIDDPSVTGDVVFGAAVEATPGALRTEGIDCAPKLASARCPGTSTTGGGGYTYGDFGTIIGKPEVHADSEIFSQALWDLRKRLIQRQGSLEAGAELAERLVTDGMRLTPPEPTFLDARNAILAAATAIDPSLRSVVWSVMAAHGMGFYAASLSGADTTPVESLSLPPADDAPTGTLAGTVTDQDTGLPLDGIHVTLAGLSGNRPYDGRDLTATTGSDGRWSLAVPAGTYGELTFGGIAGITAAVQKNLTVAAGQTYAVAQKLRRDWAATAGGATATASDDSAAGFGCGVAQLLDERADTGWSPYSPSSTSSGNPHAGAPTAVVTLPKAIVLGGLAIDPNAICGDPATAGLARYRVDAAGGDGAWHTVAQGTFPAGKGGALQPLTLTSTSSSPVLKVRLVLLSAQSSTTDFIDVADFEVYGAVPNVLPSGHLTPAPATVTPGATVKLDASSFTDPDSQIAGYDWDFDGNGTTDRTTSTPTTSTTYGHTGVDRPRVSVRDVRGGAGTASATVTVTNAAPPPTTPTTTPSTSASTLTPPPSSSTTATTPPPSSPTATTPAPPTATTTTAPAPHGGIAGGVTSTQSTDPPPDDGADGSDADGGEDPVLTAVTPSTNGRALVSVTCPSACTLAASGTLPKATAKKLGRRSRTALSSRRTLKAGATRTRLHLSSAVLASAKRKHLRRLRVTFAVSIVEQRGGGRASATRTLTLTLK